MLIFLSFLRSLKVFIIFIIIFFKKFKSFRNYLQSLEFRIIAHVLDLSAFSHLYFTLASMTKFLTTMECENWQNSTHTKRV